MGECIDAGIGVVTGRLVYPNGNWNTFKIEIGDNCCEEHAVGAAKKLMRTYEEHAPSAVLYAEDAPSVVFD